jgi:hypothetical protein
MQVSKFIAIKYGKSLGIQHFRVGAGNPALESSMPIRVFHIGNLESDRLDRPLSDDRQRLLLKAKNLETGSR